jgi:hypothetical protein
MWWTANKGIPVAIARLLAAVAPTARQPAIPGPRVYAIPSSSVSLRPASFKARPIAIGWKDRERTTVNYLATGEPTVFEPE